jgi:hypothetical protein
MASTQRICLRHALSEMSKGENEFHERKIIQLKFLSQKKTASRRHNFSDLLSFQIPRSFLFFSNTKSRARALDFSSLTRKHFSFFE